MIGDLVQGSVTVANEQLDDMVLLRADGTPTYMLAVVVDDHDMGITHVIRGDDHLNNAFRQSQIYAALGWDIPAFAHIPLIHGADGAKLSKRHGALGVGEYREMGMLPEAMRNYLLRLGWSHGDEEIIPTDKAIEWFDLGGVGKSAARFDMAKLESVNAHYLRDMDDAALAEAVKPRIEAGDRRRSTGADALAAEPKGWPAFEAARKRWSSSPKRQLLRPAAPVTRDGQGEEVASPGSRTGDLERRRPMPAGSSSPGNGRDAGACLARSGGTERTRRSSSGRSPSRCALLLTGSTESPGFFEVMRFSAAKRRSRG